MPEPLRWGLLAVSLLVLMPTIGYFNSYYLEVATQVGIFVALALGLNIVVGLAGLLDLGYVAFFAVGAYSWAIFGSPHANIIFGGESFPLAGWWFYVFLFVGLGTAAITGILLGLPVLRLHGDYLAIVTLGFGEVIRVLANNLDKPINLTNGPKGITPILRPPTPFGIPYGEFFYFLALLIVVAVIVVNRRLEDSHIGRAWEAIREDELAARAMGVSLVRMKLMAFACGASFAGVMGVLFSAKQVFINPESFTFLESIGVLAMVILGGMGSIPGAIVGATVVTVLNLQVLKGFSLWLNELKNAGVTILGFSLADLPTQFEPAKYERMGAAASASWPIEVGPSLARTTPGGRVEPRPCRPCSKPAASRRGSAGSRRCTTCTSRSTGGSRRSSGRTAPARRPCSTSSRGSTPRTRAA
ncbi:MAG: branched-chain amino acid ABC transporter permease [Candidatus Rokuibacteriota bacterium]|nr:MAG: branched-chain amino acid ABC transporter permease [Candidatus Rokubacteria bacterium]